MTWTLIITLAFIASTGASMDTMKLQFLTQANCEEAGQKIAKRFMADSVRSGRASYVCVEALRAD
jgi:hypothetical protein